MTHPTPTNSPEHLFNDTDELLRCAKATAYESADNLSGSQRDHALSVVHLIALAQTKLDAALQAQTQ